MRELVLLCRPVLHHILTVTDMRALYNTFVDNKTTDNRQKDTTNLQRIFS